MFEVKFHQGLVLKRAVAAIKELFPLSQWLCTQEGIAIRATNVTNSCFVRLTLQTDVFQSFRCDRNFTIGIDLQEFGKIMRYVTVDDVVSLMCLEMSNTIKVLVESTGEAEATEYLCRQKSLDIDFDLKIESSDAVIKMPSARLQRICKDLSGISDAVTIVCKPNEGQVLFFARGDFGSGCTHLSPTQFTDDPSLETSFEIKAPISLSFNLKHLVELCKGSAVVPQVVLRLSARGLLELVFDIKTMNPELRLNPDLPTIASIYYCAAQTLEE